MKVMRMTQDFDLHGIVGVRLVDATPDDVAKVVRQLGPIEGRLQRTPDISIRFVDRLERGGLTYAGVGDTGFSDDEFFVLRGRGSTPVKALFPFDSVGGELEIVCERAMPAIPHLLTCINMVALSKGVLPLHASAFEEDGRGVLVMGWAKGGKTETLLARMDRGADYIGDEWIYLTADGRMMGVPEPIRLWAWHLEQQPRVLSQRPVVDRSRLAVWRGLASAASNVADAGAPGAGMARRAHPLLQRQAFLQIPPAELFGSDRVVLRGQLDAVALMLSHDSPDITVGRAGPTEISGRMAASLLHERAQFMDHYRQFRYAFPDRRSTVVDAAGDLEVGLLQALFDGRPAARVAHPYPCDIAALGEAVVSAVTQTGRDVQSYDEVGQA